jgi:hypothetical protein
MKYIAHRGLFRGPDPELENSPDQILAARAAGYDCEIDLRVVDSVLWLGHDEPQYRIDREFLETPGLWIHAKNLEALRWLTDSKLVYFWHQNDKFTLTSNNMIWTYPGDDLTDISVMVMPEMIDPSLEHTLTIECHAICSDWVEKIRSLRGG